MARATFHCKLRENIWRFTFKAKILTDQSVYTIVHRSLDRLKTNVQPHLKVTTRLCFGNSAWSSTLNRV
jgi:hypothetical protein